MGNPVACFRSEQMREVGQPSWPWEWTACALLRVVECVPKGRAGLSGVHSLALARWRHNTSSPFHGPSRPKMHGTSSRLRLLCLRIFVNASSAWCCAYRHAYMHTDQAEERLVAYALVPKRTTKPCLCFLFSLIGTAFGSAGSGTAALSGWEIGDG